MEGTSPLKRLAASWSETYRCHFVANVADVTCPICHDVVKDAHVTSCCEGHFCDYCIHRILYSKDNCPLCREKQFEAVPSKKYSTKVQSLEIYCKMKCRGCPWMGPLRDATAHLDAKGGSCRYVDVECPNKCGAQIIRDNLPLHLQVACSKSESSCPYCHEKLTKGDLTRHWATCPSYPLPCPNLCGAGTLKRSEMERHLQECPLHPVKCEFFHAGCTTKIKRRDVSKHAEESTRAHLGLLSASVAKRFDQQEERLRLKDEEIEGLRSELRELQVSAITVPPVEFVISDRVQHFRDNWDWFSPDFHTHYGGYLLCLHVKKEATVSGRGFYRLTLSLKVKEGKSDSILPWPRRSAVSIQVVTYDFTIPKTIAVSLSPKATLPLLSFPSEYSDKETRNDCIAGKNHEVKFFVLKVELA